MVNNGHFDSQGDKTLLLFWPIFKLVWDFIHAINIYKFHDDPTKIMKLRCSKRRLWPFLTINGTQLYHFWSDLTIFELARDFMHITVIFQV